VGHPLVVNVKTEGCEIYVGRGTPWGNPYKGGTRAQNIAVFRSYLEVNPKLVERAKGELRGKVLGCHCAPKDCHADVWAEIVNEEEP
jgi:hypothetical protein